MHASRPKTMREHLYANRQLEIDRNGREKSINIINNAIDEKKNTKK